MTVDTAQSAAGRWVWISWLCQVIQKNRNFSGKKQNILNIFAKYFYLHSLNEQSLQCQLVNLITGSQNPKQTSTNAPVLVPDTEVLPAAEAAVLFAPSLRFLRAPLLHLLLTLSGCQLEVTDPRPPSCSLDKQRRRSGQKETLASLERGGATAEARCSDVPSEQSTLHSSSSISHPRIHLSSSL